MGTEKKKPDIKAVLRRKREARAHAMMAGFGQNSIPKAVRETSLDDIRSSVRHVADSVIRSVPRELLD